MPLREYPSQPLQDWLSQRWVMLCGRQIDPADFPWLMGPFGEVDVIGDAHIDRLARDENLRVERNSEGVGLLDSVNDLAQDGSLEQRLAQPVTDFYEQTADYDLEVWSEWNPVFKPFGSLIQRIYSRRLQQLNLPQRPFDTSRGISSEIAKLYDTKSGSLRYTFWNRRLKSSGAAIYSGNYSAGELPDGRRCMKVVFPLPRGNATVVMSVEAEEDGALTLVSEGRRFGDPGFYFLLRDSRGRHWTQYIRSMRERITVYVDDEGVLRANHALTLWRFPVMRLHYKMTRRSK